MRLYYGSTPIAQVSLDDLEQQNTLAVDIETVSLEDKTPIGFAVAWSPHDAMYFTWDEPTAPWHLFFNSTITFVFHNALFDVPAITYKLLQSKPNKFYPNAHQFYPKKLEDTMLMCNHANIPRELWAAASHFGFGNVIPAKEMLAKAKNSAKHKPTMLDIPTEEVARKCCIDAQATFYLAQEFSKPAYGDFPYAPYKLECDILPSCMRMSEVGIKIDQERLLEHAHEVESDVVLYKNMCTDWGFNPASPKQVGDILLSRGNKLPKTWKTQKAKTGEKELLKLNDPLAQLTLLYREKAKMLGTYIIPLIGEERVFYDFHINTLSGRPTTSNRNMQNQPKSIRDIFIPDSDYWTDVDFSQIELRVLAYLSQDPVMLEIFASGGDIHQETLIALGLDHSHLDAERQRFVAKTVNFGIPYGITDAGLVDNLSTEGIIITLHDASNFIFQWLLRFSQASVWMEEQREFGIAHGYVVTPMGRRMEIEELINGHNWEHGLKKCVNLPIQGGASEIVKKAMLVCQNDGLPMVLQIHDELLFNGIVDMPEIENLGPMHTPITCKFLERWG